MNTLPSEAAAIVGAIDPDAYSATAYSTGYISMANFRRFMALIMVGDMVTNSTVDAKLTVYTNASGGGAFDVPGAAITQLTQAGTDSNKQAVINLNTDVLAGNTKYTHLRLTVTVGTAASDMGALVFGFDPPYAPASTFDATTVDEIVIV